MLKRRLKCIAIISITSLIVFIGIGYLLGNPTFRIIRAYDEGFYYTPFSSTGEIIKAIFFQLVNIARFFLRIIVSLCIGIWVYITLFGDKQKTIDITHLK